MIHHRLLHRMQRAVRIRQMLNRQQLLSIQRRNEQNAGIHRLMPSLPIHQHHGAGPAVPLGAAFLGAAQPLRPAQIFQHGHRRVHVPQRPLLLPELEMNGVAHRAAGPFVVRCSVLHRRS